MCGSLRNWVQVPAPKPSNASLASSVFRDLESILRRSDMPPRKEKNQSRRCRIGEPRISQRPSRLYLVARPRTKKKAICFGMERWGPCFCEAQQSCLSPVVVVTCCHMHQHLRLHHHECMGIIRAFPRYQMHPEYEFRAQTFFVRHEGASCRKASFIVRIRLRF